MATKDAHLFWLGLALQYENLPGIQMERMVIMDSLFQITASTLGYEIMQKSSLYKTLAHVLSLPKDSKAMSGTLMDWLFNGIVNSDKKTFYKHVRDELDQLPKENQRRFFDHALFEIEYGNYRDDDCKLAFCVGGMAWWEESVSSLGYDLALHVILNSTHQDVRCAVLAGIFESDNELAHQAYCNIKTKIEKEKGIEEWLSLISFLMVSKCVPENSMAIENLITFSKDEKEMKCVIASYTKLFCKNDAEWIAINIAKATNKMKSPKRFIKEVWRSIFVADVNLNSIKKLAAHLETNMAEELNEELMIDHETLYEIFKSSGTLVLF